jgi:thymidylate synthase ThyX
MKTRKRPYKLMRQSLGRQQKQDVIRHKLPQSTKN